MGNSIRKQKLYIIVTDGWACTRCALGGAYKDNSY